MNGVTLLESSWRFSSIFCEKNCIVKSCTKTGRVRLRWSEGEKGKKGGKAARCMVNALFICLAELKLQVCGLKKWVMLSSIAYQLNKSPIYFFHPLCRNIQNGTQIARNNCKHDFELSTFFYMSGTIFFIISIFKYKQCNLF